jgi:hypothetical protein
MKTQKIAITIAGSIVIALAYSSALAQQPVITSFQGNGQLTWTNLPGTNGFTVQWAPAVTGPWSSNWQALDSIVVTGVQTTVSVPMFYRVAQGFSCASMRGTWIMSDPTHGNTYFIAQDDGILSESAMFIPRGPAGYFTLGASGRLTNTFVTTESTITLPGTFASANLITLDPPYANSVIRRLEDASRCAGNWTGTLSQTNGPGMPASYPVTFSVDTRGLVTNFTGFTGVAIGRMFALTNGAAVGFFFTGRESDNGVYNQIKISGTLSGNTFTGSYYTDSGNGADAVLGTASLTRQ